MAATLLSSCSASRQGRFRRLLVTLAATSLVLGLSAVFPNSAAAQRQIKTVDPPPKAEWFGLPGKFRQRNAPAAPTPEFSQQPSWPSPQVVSVGGHQLVPTGRAPNVPGQLPLDRDPMFTNLNEAAAAGAKQSSATARRRAVGF